MTTKLVGANSIKDGSFILIDGAPCRVVDVAHSKSGKHGSAKCRIQGIGLLDERKREFVVGAQENVEVPVIDKRTAQIMSITGDMATVMDLETYETVEMKIPEELKGQIQEGGSILYWVIMGTKVMKQVRGAE